MKRKNILSIVSIMLILFVSFALIYYFINLKTLNSLETNLAKVDSINKKINIIPIDNTISKDQIAISTQSKGIYMNNNMENNTFIAEDAEIIIIGTINSLDGVVNYNPSTENYVMTRTVGMVKVNKIIKGDLKESEIPFIKLGGIIPISEYEKGIPEEQAEKFGFKQMSITEKETKYVSEQLEEDIEIEQGKTYLMYLKYYSDYGRYSIVYLKYGLRELEAQNLQSLLNSMSNKSTILSSDELKTIKVKNNKTGEYEILDSILPEKIKNSK